MFVSSDPHLSLIGLLDPSAGDETTVTDTRTYCSSYGNMSSQFSMLDFTTNITIKYKVG
ncbi:hypothetical protein DPMN_019374 [Dreissena polymorpha]|uniref:Uncharacterized protein n=1 Tax=Dreissena polymorpha TaxID=45954 RepID=A0A9D4S7A1_DREPO|nr:hypothetical protein DPMN_019374 [Dreissena polymorpha]